MTTPASVVTAEEKRVNEEFASWFREALQRHNDLSDPEAMVKARKILKGFGIEYRVREEDFDKTLLESWKCLSLKVSLINDDKNTRYSYKTLLRVIRDTRIPLDILRHLLPEKVTQRLLEHEDVQYRNASDEAVCIRGADDKDKMLLILVIRASHSMIYGGWYAYATSMKDLSSSGYFCDYHDGKTSELKASVEERDSVLPVHKITRTQPDFLRGIVTL